MELNAYIDNAWTGLMRLLTESNINRLGKVVKVALIIVSAICILLFIGAILDSQLSGYITELKAPAPAPNIQPIEHEESQNTGRYKLIARKSLFGPLGRVAPMATPTPNLKVTALPLALLGTFVSDGGDAPFAIIENKTTREQDGFKVGDKLFEDATLKQVYKDRVEILRGGETEVLKLEDAPGASYEFKDGIASLGSNQYIIQPEELDKQLADLNLLLTQARAIPYYKDGKAVGLRLFAIKPKSLFAKIGLLSGDILKSINGNSLANLSEALKLFERLKQEKSLTLKLDRARDELTMHYKIGN